MNTPSPEYLEQMLQELREDFVRERIAKLTLAQRLDDLEKRVAALEAK